MLRTDLAALLVTTLAGAAAPAVTRAQGTEKDAASEAPAARPNIVWIIVEDMSAHFGCYGETSIRTPHVDRLAAEGLRFTNAIVTAPVCSASRSALITGMYQTSVGAHHHRSGRGRLKIHLPEPVRPIPELFQEAGYETLNLTFADFVRSDAELEKDASVRVAKTDYNFEWKPSLYSRLHWRKRPAGRPFFAQVQLHGGKHRGGGVGTRWPGRVEKVLGERTPQSKVTLPPYLPPDAVILEDWAQYLDTARMTDFEVGRILERLEEARELSRTYVFFITDHGISHARNKQFCYEGGVHIPFIVRGPGIKPGSVRRDVVEHIDLAATSLALAGIARPEWMQARDVLAREYRPRRFAFAARDRCDETVDRIRCVRSERFKYIRNFLPERPYLQPNAYKDAKPIVQALRRLHAKGKLDPAQSLVMAERRPPEELYDLEKDPFELVNLAADPSRSDVLLEMRHALDAWIERTADRGPESRAMYESDMELYTRGREVVQKNIEWMLRRAEEEARAGAEDAESAPGSEK